MWECFVACRTSSATWFSSGTYREVRLWSGPSPNCCTLRWRRSSGPNYCPRPRTALSRSDKHSLYVYWSIFYGKGEANKNAIVFLTVVLFYEFGKTLDRKTVGDMNFMSHSCHWYLYCFPWLHDAWLIGRLWLMFVLIGHLSVKFIFIGCLWLKFVLIGL